MTKRILFLEGESRATRKGCQCCVCLLFRQKYLKVASENANAILAIEPSSKVGKGKIGLSGVQVRLLWCTHA